VPIPSASISRKINSRPPAHSSRKHRLEFPLIHASAEHVPLPDDCANLVISEYGASLWCDPDAWLAEAACLLRPNGQIVFLTNSLLIALTAPDHGPATDRLLRGQRALKVVTYPDEPGVEFDLAPGDWIATLRRPGFTVDALHELYRPMTPHPPHTNGSRRNGRGAGPTKRFGLRRQVVQINAPGLSTTFRPPEWSSRVPIPAGRPRSPIARSPGGARAVP
jgi:SAM-dependent methyltransferase